MVKKLTNVVKKLIDNRSTCLFIYLIKCRSSGQNFENKITRKGLKNKTPKIVKSDRKITCKKGSTKLVILWDVSSGSCESMATPFKLLKYGQWKNLLILNED